MEKIDFHAFLKQLSESPGVYQMINHLGETIYIGKAKNLKKRVSSYFKKKLEHSKTAHMVSQIYDIQVMITESETEALLLESNLIKKFQPKYNILLRDDKSYPYILVDLSHPFPRLKFYRGSNSIKEKLFGPFPNVTAVKESLDFLQKLFKLRSCRQSYFKNRTRPCLQYQIKRCSAPCVGKISQDDYSNDLHMAMEFLKGQSDKLIRYLEKKMTHASNEQHYELAAQVRDQIQQLRSIQTSQTISNKGGDADVIAIYLSPPYSVVLLLMIRKGQVIGSHAFYPKVTKAIEQLSESNILEAFLGQFYLDATRQYPKEIISNAIVSNILASTISIQAGRKINIFDKPKGIRQKWVKLALQNAVLSLDQKLSSQANINKRYQALKDILGLEDSLNRLECFDISHTSGEQTVASCVVFDEQGPQKSAYRKFNIEGITGGDDYAAMRQALIRRYTRLIKENRPLPDLLIIDGGKGQVNVAIEVMTQLNVEQKIIGVAKGVSRKAGLETIIVAFNNQELHIDADNPALHLIQHIRDEAHRFAIITHRHKRDGKKISSTLEDIEGVGSKRRQALLKRFGGIQSLKEATIEEISKVPGISKSLAKKVYNFFH